MIVRILIPILLISALCAACSPVSLLNLTIPTSGYTVHKNMAYGDNARQKVDIYVPDGTGREHPAPVIVFFYGGSWQYGKKEDYPFLGQAFASRGFVTVIADYRLYPEVYFPAFIDDGAQAFRWVHNHIAEYGGNQDAMFLAGHSAGAHIAMMLSLNAHYLEKAGVERKWVKGTIGISGPYDFLPFEDKYIKALFSKAPDADTQPITFASTSHPPLLLATGDDDDTVLPGNTRNLSEKLKSFHNPAQVKIYEGVGHTGIMLSLARGFRGKTTLLDDITAFIENTYKPHAIE